MKPVSPEQVQQEDDLPLKVRLASLGGMLAVLVVAVVVTLMAASSWCAQPRPAVADWQFHDK